MTSLSESTPLIVKLNDVNGGDETVNFSSRVTRFNTSPTYIADNGKMGRSVYNSVQLSWHRSTSNLSDVLSSMKRIGYLGSWSIAVNSLTGPAMLCLPDTYQRAGLIPTTVVIIFVCILSAFCCLHMSNTISKVPGNWNFIKDVRNVMIICGLSSVFCSIQFVSLTSSLFGRCLSVAFLYAMVYFQIGYSECFSQFWGPKSYHYTQILFFLCITCLNVTSIVDIAQVVDTFLGHWISGGSGALQFQWIDSTILVQVDWVRWDYQSCSEEMLIQGDCVPFFEHEGMLLTVGYIIVLLIFMPMAMMNLKVSCMFVSADDCDLRAMANSTFNDYSPNNISNHSFSNRKMRLCKLLDSSFCSSHPSDS